MERAYEVQEISASFPASMDSRNTLFNFGLSTLDFVSSVKVVGVSSVESSG